MTATLPQPVVLAGSHVRLGPVCLQHVGDLFAAGGRETELCRWLPFAALMTLAEMRGLISRVIGAQADGACVPFAVVGRETDRTVGWTAHLDAPIFETGIEIGWTWLTRAVWRAAVNTEARQLLLGHAFDTLGLDRVQLKTDVLDTRTRRAIERLGAQREGVLRHYWRRHLARQRVRLDTRPPMAHQWPTVCSHLTQRAGQATRSVNTRS